MASVILPTLYVDPESSSFELVVKLHPVAQRKVKCIREVSDVPHDDRDSGP